MISRTSLILSTLAFCTLATQDANAACSGGSCSLKRAPAPKAVQARKVAAVKTVKGCKTCKKGKRVKRYGRRNNRRVRTIAAVQQTKQVCTTGLCSFRK